MYSFLRVGRLCILGRWRIERSGDVPPASSRGSLRSKRSSTFGMTSAEISRHRAIETSKPFKLSKDVGPIWKSSFLFLLSGICRDLRCTPRPTSVPVREQGLILSHLRWRPRLHVGSTRRRLLSRRTWVNTRQEYCSYPMRTVEATFVEGPFSRQSAHTWAC